jgi:hypothetical protein
MSNILVLKYNLYFSLKDVNSISSTIDVTTIIDYGVVNKQQYSSR